MKVAVITDSSAYLPAELKDRENFFVLDIPITIQGETYVEGVNLTTEDFYAKMAASPELPTTSQPSVAALDDILSALPEQGYTHVIGLFLSSGISGFFQNIQYLIEEHSDLTIAFPDTKITATPLGVMARNTLNWVEAGLDFETILDKLQQMIEQTTAFIMVDDLKHLVKGGRLSNGSAILGTLLSIKPILYFNDEGVITVYEKVRTEKKAVKRLVEILQENTGGGDYEVYILHTNALEKAQHLQELLTVLGKTTQISPLNSVIATHLGEGAVAIGYTPIV
ncbi:DegV family protein [Streptococcus ovuberis]|uniref:DegV family protein n=1 Tax=Streptococcus ovuberis TaxID=1936207 RepID=A0A7X6MYJ1_9STRE|nr:DegV family protein [Streptococcus ovuberis]NKZ20069.1 DegV family protein [Streptococcus ovuberis]